MTTGQRPSLDRLIYIDDSGSQQSGIVAYGWVEVAPADWSMALREWLNLRKALFADYAVPPSAELHCTDYVQGRGVSGSGHISTDPPERYRIDPTDTTIPAASNTLWKDLGRDVAVQCLDTLRASTTLSVGAVWRKTTATGGAYATEKYALYDELVLMLDDDLRASNSLGLITMDGDDVHYRQAHRRLKLATRHVLEDPACHDSKVSQWTQIADLVAYAAYMKVNHFWQHQFAWAWYDDYLAVRDPRGGPLAL